MPNGSAMQNYTGASGHERICMKLLVPECSHVALIARNELIEIVKLPPKASGIRHTDGHLLRAARARVTFSRMSEAFAVQMMGLGF